MTMPVPSAQLDGSAPADARLVAILQRAVAEELRHVRERLEELGMELVSDAHFVDHHCERLQTFDLLAQYTEESAAILDRLAGGACSHSAIAPVRLGVVHERLTTRLAVGAADTPNDG